MAKPPNNLAELGTYLKRLRLDLGLSLRHAARLAHISPAHLCKIEQGNNFSSVGLHVILNLARIYKIPVSAILHEGGLIDEVEDHLPSFAHYLRHKYHLSPTAIRDIEMALDVVKKKYALDESRKRNKAYSPKNNHTLFSN